MSTSRLVTVLTVVAVSVFGAANGAGATGSLVQNGGAEQGAGSTDGSVVAVPGWTTTGSFTVVRYGSPGFPAAAHPGQGANFFAAGSQASSTATQEIDLGGSRGAIDASRLDARVSALVQGRGAIAVTTRSASGRTLSRRTLGAPTGSSGAFGRATALLPIPPRARSVTLRLKGSGAYFDDVTLTPVPLAIPRPARGDTALVKPARGVVVVFRRGNRKVITRPTLVPLGTVVDTSKGAAGVVTATDRYGMETDNGNFAEGQFSVSQVGGDTSISLGGRGPRTCTQPRRLLSRATSGFMVLAGAMGSRAATGRAVWVAVDHCDAATVKTHAGRVDVAALGSRSASGCSVINRFRGNHAFTTRGRNSSATVRGRILSSRRSNIRRVGAYRILRNLGPCR